MASPLLALALTVAPIAAAPDTSVVPDPDYCSVVPCDEIAGILTTPHSGAGPAAARFVVTVQPAQGVPLPNAFVEIIPADPTAHVLCPQARLTGLTDANGRVEFDLAMGGCTLRPNAVRIRANGVIIRSYPRLVSPDYDGEADGAVVLSDFTVFGTALVTGAGGCTDYYNDGTTGVDDFTGFAACWGRSCEH